MSTSRQVYRLLPIIDTITITLSLTHPPTHPPTAVSEIEKFNIVYGNVCNTFENRILGVNHLLSNASGTGSVTLSAQGFLRSCYKLLPENIVESRPASPGSPRMVTDEMKLDHNKFSMKLKENIIDPFHASTARLLWCKGICMSI